MLKEGGVTTPAASASSGHLKAQNLHTTPTYKFRSSEGEPSRLLLQAPQEMLFLPDKLRTTDTHHASPDSLSMCLCHKAFFLVPTFVVAVQLLSHVRLFVTPWTAACQTFLSFTNSWSFPKLMSIEWVMSSKHLILYHPLLLPSILPSIKVFSSESVLYIGGQSIGASASASVLPMNMCASNQISYDFYML